MLLLWQKRGLVSAMLATASYPSAVPHEPPTSWIGRVGPPEHLNEVNLEPPMLSIPAEQLNILDEELNSWALTMGNISIESLWDYGLVSARTMYGDLF